MIVYVAMFILSLISFKIALKFKDNNKNALFLIFSGIGIFLPCLLAGMRDVSIGTDTKHFAMYNFKQAYYYGNLFDFIKLFPKGELLYWTICWMSANIFNNIGFSFFLYELLIVLPMYITLLKIKKSNNFVIFGMLIFYLLLYNQSLNMVRQSIALSFSLLAIVLFEEKKYVKVVILTIVASLFHMSAFVMLALYLVYGLLNLKIKRGRLILELSIIIGFILFLVNFENILLLFAKIFSDSVGIYSVYLESDFYKYGAGNFFWSEFIINCLLLLLMMVFKKNIQKYVPNYDFYFLMMIIMFSSNYLSNIIVSAERIMYYIKYPLYFLVFARLPFYLTNKSNKTIVSFSILLYCLYFFVFHILIYNANETIPYIFR